MAAMPPDQKPQSRLAVVAAVRVRLIAATPKKLIIQVPSPMKHAGWWDV